MEIFRSLFQPLSDLGGTNAFETHCYEDVYLTVNSVIFSGHSGQGMREWIKIVLNQDLTFQHIKIIYPTAPSRYAMLNFTSQ